MLHSSLSWLTRPISPLCLSLPLALSPVRSSTLGHLSCSRKKIQTRLPTSFALEFSGMLLFRHPCPSLQTRIAPRRVHSWRMDHTKLWLNALVLAEACKRVEKERKRERDKVLGNGQLDDGNVSPRVKVLFEARIPEEGLAGPPYY